MQSLQRHHKANLSSDLARQYSGQYLCCVEVIIELEAGKMLSGFGKMLFNFVLIVQSFD